jgi:hypothetical protein
MRHCRYCGNTGHNRRTCPSRSPETKKADNEYHKRYRSRSRTCRYCRGSNHDRRKCDKLIADRADWVTRNAAFRKRFLEDAKKVGWGVGCIIKMTHWNNADFYYLVEKINWDAVVVDSRYNYAMTVSQIGGEDHNNYNPPRYFGVEDVNDREYFIKNCDMAIENPVTAESIEKAIPSNWLSGETTKNYMPGSLQ